MKKAYGVLMSFAIIAAVIGVSAGSAFAAEKKKMASQTAAQKTAYTAKPGAFGGDPGKFATAVKAISTIDPKALSAATKVGNNKALLTLTKNPNSLKAITAMSKARSAEAKR